MLDVARNFTKKGNILKLIDYLASYKISVLHLHLTDDEAWRIMTAQILAAKSEVQPHAKTA
jgi:N-acetyl-beta-hexosaminidase